jgi:hypothetical protein
MSAARVCWLTIRLAAGAALASSLLLALLWTAGIALSNDGPVASHWVQEPAPAQVLRWVPVYGNDISFCLEDRAGVGVTDAWVQDNLSRYWGVNSHPSCAPGVTPDLRIVIEDFESPQPAGWTRVNTASDQSGWFNLRFYQQCEIALNSAVFWQRLDYVWPGTSTWVPDVPEKTLLHEFGHCAGMSHRDEPGYQGAMYPMMLYYPNEEDVASLHQDYGLSLLLRLIQPVLSVMGIGA